MPGRVFLPENRRAVVQSLKEIVKSVFVFCGIHPTRNMQYDFYTRKILRTRLRNNSNCIDIGTHKGEILDLMLKHAPDGTHLGFEPIPAMYEHLKKAYHGRASIFPYALSSKNGNTTFQVVENAPEYSGLRRRDYGSMQPTIKEIMVETKKLDDIIDPDFRVDLIKIDVEGAEMLVLEGAANTINKWKPLVIFEFGIGAADFYDSKPETIYHFFESSKMRIFSLSNDFFKAIPLNLEQFVQVYKAQEHYYFVAIN